VQTWTGCARGRPHDNKRPR